MAHRCAILDDYQNVALKMADWTKLGRDCEIKVFNAGLGSTDKVVAALKGFDIVCLMRERTPFGKAVIDGLPDLKLIVTSGMRNAAIDLEAAAARNIVVCGTESPGSPTAELTFGLMLELARKIGFENARLKAGAPWQSTLGIELDGKTLGVIGLGKLGSKVATYAKAFGMNVIAWSQNLTAEKASAGGASLVSKDDLFRQSDFISIHVQLSPRTRGMVTAKELALMKPTAFLVNTSRGPIVEEAALLSVLREKKIARRHRRLRRRTAAARSSVPQDRQCRDHAASRLRHRRGLSPLLRPDGRRHPRLAGRQADPDDGTALAASEMADALSADRWTDRQLPVGSGSFSRSCRVLRRRSWRRRRAAGAAGLRGRPRQPATERRRERRAHALRHLEPARAIAARLLRDAGCDPRDRACGSIANCAAPLPRSAPHRVCRMPTSPPSASA